MTLGAIMKDLQNGARARRKGWKNGTYLICNSLSAETKPKLHLINDLGEMSLFDVSVSDLIADDWTIIYPTLKHDAEFKVGQKLYMYAVSWIIVEVDEVNEPIDNSNLERSGIAYTAICEKPLVYKMPACITTIDKRLVDNKISLRKLDLIPTACLDLMDALHNDSFDGTNVLVRVPTNSEIQKWFPDKSSRMCKNVGGQAFPYWTCDEMYSRFYTQVDQDGDVRMDLRSDMDPTLFGAFRPVICWSVY